MESADQSSVDQAHQFLVNQIPSNDVIHYDPDAIAHATQSIQDIMNGSINDNPLQLAVSSAFQVSHHFFDVAISCHVLLFRFLQFPEEYIEDRTSNN